jgi:hypothetical protein
LPDCVKDINKSYEFEGVYRASLVLFSLPYLLKSYLVAKQAADARFITNEWQWVNGKVQEVYPHVYAEILGQRVKRYDYPTAGDAVRLTGEWFGCKPGQIGILGGRVGYQHEDFSITFNCNGQAHRGWSSDGGPVIPLNDPKFTKTDGWSECVSCSGGPATIWTPAAKLTPTTDFHTQSFWCWRSLPEAHSGVHYSVTVPVWEWDGKDKSHHDPSNH